LPLHETRQAAYPPSIAISAGDYQPADERMLSVIATPAAIGGPLLITLILVGRWR
jgi:hypothetical protein